MGKKKKKQNRNKNKHAVKMNSVLSTAKVAKKTDIPKAEKPMHEKTPDEIQAVKDSEEPKTREDVAKGSGQELEASGEVVLEKIEPKETEAVDVDNVDEEKRTEIDAGAVSESVAEVENDRKEHPEDVAEKSEEERAEDITKKEAAVSGAGDLSVIDAIDREIPEAKDGKKRRSYRMWIWWGVGICCLVMLAVGGLALAKLFSGDNGDGDLSSGEMIIEEVPEEVTKEETSGEPVEEEKPEEKEPEPVEEEIKPEEIPAIAPRPEPVKDYPEVTGGSRVVALTFDDGPSAATTPRLLDILKSKNVKATFFVLGTMARKAPDLLVRERTEGHEVASHTPYHTQQTLLGAAQVRAEALEMDQIFTEILGTVPPFTRPPYGSYNQTVQEAMGQPLILWSVDPRDWQYRDASVVCSNVVSAATDGAVILVHDIHASTVDAVPCIIDTLRARGFEFMTVSELAAYKDVPLVNGGVYGRF